jgi:hypothetical protein
MMEQASDGAAEAADLGSGSGTAKGVERGGGEIMLGPASLSGVRRFEVRRKALHSDQAIELGILTSQTGERHGTSNNLKFLFEIFPSTGSLALGSGSKSIPLSRLWPFVRLGGGCANTT